MADTKVCRKKIRETQFDIYVNGQGEFFVNYEGDAVRNPTLTGLEKRLLELTKRKAAHLKIDFWRWQVLDRWERDSGSHGKLVHGVVTGMYGRNNNLLVKMDGGKPEQETHWNNDDRYLKLDAGEQAAFVRLCLAKEEAEDAVKAFVEAHKFDAKQEVRRALGSEDEDGGD